MKWLPVVLLLTGCANFAPSKFDSALYDHLVILSVDVEKVQTVCGTPEFTGSIAQLEYESKIALRYTEGTSQDVYDLMVIIDRDISKLATAAGQTPPPTKLYCALTLKVIDKETRSLLTAVGGKQR